MTTPQEINVKPKNSGKHKQTVEEILADISPLETIKFNPMKPFNRSPVPNIPENINIRDPYTPFTLFFSETDIQSIAESINEYAEMQIQSNPSTNSQD
ncbi:hypothetical protein EMCG_00853 [[Emmonsia] crescens]|uniref:Uncharacterized protein n=1 Tax=[Emmonsia] crescens TaxID=73230 RepID=A0A0G2HQ71_9EURO|nr:hypothetical protein EMCG_00853 [Emmonsia crescens UAMH 3008]